MCIAIYCVEEVDLYRYNSLWLKLIEPNKESILLMSDEKIRSSTVSTFAKNFKNVYQYRTNFTGPKAIERKLVKKGVKVLVINALSVPDLRVAKALTNLKDIKLVYLQHGLYIPYMKRNVGFFFKEAKKVISYFYYSLSIVNYYRLIKALKIMGVFVLGWSRNNIPDHLLKRVNKSLVFSRYWKSWHRHVYKLNSDFQVIGTPDLGTFRYSQNKDAIIYCSQTLVEDGRIEQEVIFQFYDDLRQYAERLGNVPVVVKIHPRNSEETLEKMRQLNFSIEKDTIPLGKVVVGHYSSLLPVWGVNKIPMLVVELPGHITPLSIRNSASEVVDQEEFRNMSSMPTEVSEKIDYYFSPLVENDKILASVLEN